MRPHLQGLAMVACALVGLGFAVNWVTIDVPIYFGFLHADYPNPDGPGLKGVLVSTPEFLAKAMLTVALLALAVWFHRCLRKSDRLQTQVFSD